VSGHLAWSTNDGEYLNDLLPLPYDDEALRLLAGHLHEVQDGLGRPYLLETLSQAVQALPRGQRRAIEMLKLGGMSLKEAAAASGTSISALKIATHRAINALRKTLTKER
jgi:uncharacterized protein (UPF0276 family)